MASMVWGMYQLSFSTGYSIVQLWSIAIKNSSHRPHTDMLVSQLDSTKYKNIIMSQALTVIHANMYIKETCTIPLPERKGLHVYIYT